MAPSSQALLCRYHYDPLDRLAGAAPTGQAQVQRFYQKSRLATEIQGAFGRTIVQYEDQVLAQRQSRFKVVAETTLLATDQQRTVLQLLDKNGTEAVVYNAYGHHSVDSGLACLLGFTGEHRDPITGHYLLGNGYRAFNPVLMRFNSPDRLSPFGAGGVNAYAYCQGDPVNFYDWMGRSPIGAVCERLVLYQDSGPRRSSALAILLSRMQIRLLIMIMRMLSRMHFHSSRLIPILRFLVQAPPLHL
jgi:RHS repeat-associated protein